MYVQDVLKLVSLICSIIINNKFMFIKQTNFFSLTRLRKQVLESSEVDSDEESEQLKLLADGRLVIEVPIVDSMAVSSYR